MQDGMFHKNGRKKLEKLRIDRRKQVWYDIYVGRLMEESRPVLFGGTGGAVNDHRTHIGH